MGMIDFSLYVSDDDSPEIVALRPPPVVRKTVVEPEPVIKVFFFILEKYFQMCANKLYTQ